MRPLVQQRPGNPHCTGDIQLIGVKQNLPFDGGRRLAPAPVPVGGDTVPHPAGVLLCPADAGQKMVCLSRANLRMVNRWVSVLFRASDVMQQAGGSQDA